MICFLVASLKDMFVYAVSVSGLTHSSIFSRTFCYDLCSEIHESILRWKSRGTYIMSS